MAHVDCSFYSPSLQKNAHMIVFLPSVTADDYLEDREIHYNDAETRYPVLFLLHGSYGDCMDWCLRTGIERYAQDKGIAVVMPSGENSSYVNMHQGEAYLRYIGEELPNFVRTMFPISDRREDTYIAGLSMGGYGTYRVALEYPETFGYAASLSGALDMQALQNSDAPHIKKMDPSYRMAVFKDPQKISGTDNDLVTKLATLLSTGATPPELYMICGTEDFILPTNEAFYEHAVKLGVQPTYIKCPGAHTWDFWDTHIKDVLNWLP